MHISFVLIVISDRAFSGDRPDKTAALLAKWCEGKNYRLLSSQVVPDKDEYITRTLTDFLNNEEARVIICTGGTGFSPADITPEVVSRFMEKRTPGIDEFLRRKGAEKNPYAILSRGISGINGNKLILSLPGNPAAVIESMSFLQDILPHAIKSIGKNRDR